MSMLRRLSTQFKRNKDANGDAEPKSAPKSAPKSTKEPSSKRFSKSAGPRKASNDEAHAVKRSEVEAIFDKYAQAIHASREPLPNQTGDDTYLKHEESGGLLNDIKSLGFRDINTVKDLIKNKASGELIDDKTYLMERIIQVCNLLISSSRLQLASILPMGHGRGANPMLKYSLLPICLVPPRTVLSSRTSSLTSCGTRCHTPLSRKIPDSDISDVSRLLIPLIA